MSQPDRDLTLDETLETLRTSLDPEAFGIAKAALEAAAVRRAEARQSEADQALITQLIVGYDYALERSRAGYAHVEGAVMDPAYEYLRRKADVPATTELDRITRLFSAYAICKDGDLCEDPEEAIRLIRSALVSPEDVYALIKQYWQEQKIVFGDSWPPADRLEDVLAQERLTADATWDYFPSPGLAERIRGDLQSRNLNNSSGR